MQSRNSDITNNALAVKIDLKWQLTCFIHLKKISTQLLISVDHNNIYSAFIKKILSLCYTFILNMCKLYYLQIILTPTGFRQYENHQSLLSSDIIFYKALWHMVAKKTSLPQTPGTVLVQKVLHLVSTHKTWHLSKVLFKRLCLRGYVYKVFKSWPLSACNDFWPSNNMINLLNVVCLWNKYKICSSFDSSNIMFSMQA